MDWNVPEGPDGFRYEISDLFREILLHRSCGVYAWKWVLNLNPRVWVLSFLTMPSKMVAMMDLDQNQFPSTASFCAPFCFHV